MKARRTKLIHVVPYVPLEEAGGGDGTQSASGHILCVVAGRQGLDGAGGLGRSKFSNSNATHRGLP